jgi:hypothetical protein
MFRSSMRSSSGSFLFISLSMLLILKVIKIFKKCYHSVVVMWQHMSSVPVMRTVWRRELDTHTVSNTELKARRQSTELQIISVSKTGFRGNPKGWHGSERRKCVKTEEFYWLS